MITIKNLAQGSHLNTSLVYLFGNNDLITSNISLIVDGIKSTKKS